MEHTLKSPARTVFGAGTLDELNREIPPFLRKILLVVGNHAVSGGLLERVKTILAGRELTMCSGIHPEPPLPDVQHLIDTGREAGVHAVVAIGGGKDSLVSIEALRAAYAFTDINIGQCLVVCILHHGKIGTGGVLDVLVNINHHIAVKDGCHDLL